ncbi:MAG: rhodanese-related sulfurtransferase [Pseudomonadota bacterium]
MFHVAALYHFTEFSDPAALRHGLVDVCEAHGVKGTLLVAPEGINGTIAGSRLGIDAVLAAVRRLPGCEGLVWKESTASEAPFKKLKVRLKREIVTMGQPQVRPNEGTGHYVEAADWDALIASPDVVTIDTRNDYEVAIGSFKGAVNPQTRSFGEFPAWWQENKDHFEGKRIAMFCTGGIRCEKSTNYLIGEGVKDVFHLKGGILKYLEDVPEEKSSWDGACFVFDRRVSVTHGLREGKHMLCHACRRPLEPEDASRREYEQGVQCHHCVEEYSEADRERFRERERQLRLQESRL